MRKRSSSILAAGMMFPVLAGIVACNFKSQHSGANAAEIPSANVAAAMRGDIAHTLSLAGQFQPYQVVDVHPKVTGFMVKINVDIGDRVRKGETLAVLEVPELNAQLKGTVFEMQRAKDDLLRAQNEIKRDEAIHSALHADVYKRQEQGNSAAQFNLGLLYDNGQGVERDYAQAAVWYNKAADQGLARAQYNLCLLYTSRCV